MSPMVDLYKAEETQWHGKHIRVISGESAGKTGVITGWYGFMEPLTFGSVVVQPSLDYHMAVVSGDNGEAFQVRPTWCKEDPK